MVICLASMAVMCQGQYQYSSDQVQNYRMLPTSRVTGRERAMCEGTYSRCYGVVLSCPAECPVRKPIKAKKVKGCMINCSKCETSCKFRKPNCKGYGSICYDPRFVGGDGVMFYFHGMKDRDFALVSDDKLQINAHFIGTRPEGRKRDYTWVQALGIMFGGRKAHTFTVGANKVSKWDDSVDQFTFSFDGQDLKVADIWTSPCGQLILERTDETNSVNVIVGGLARISLNVAPIEERDNKMHNYQLPPNDAFAHLEMQFKFFNLSSTVEGILGQTYRPNFVNPVKRGVPMPVMGGEDRYATSSLLSADCKSCNYSNNKDAHSSSSEFLVNPVGTFDAECTSRSGNGGIVCRR